MATYELQKQDIIICESSGFCGAESTREGGGGANSMYVYVYAQTRFRPKRYNYVLYCTYICEPYYLSICVRCAILFVIPMYLLHCRRLVLDNCVHSEGE